MSQRRNTSLLESTYDFLTDAPWWGGPVLAASIWAFLYHILPPFIPDTFNGVEVGRFVLPHLRMLAIGLPVAVLVLWIIGEVKNKAFRR